MANLFPNIIGQLNEFLKSYIESAGSMYTEWRSSGENDSEHNFNYIEELIIILDQGKRNPKKESCDKFLFLFGLFFISRSLCNSFKKKLSKW